MTPQYPATVSYYPPDPSDHIHHHSSPRVYQQTRHQINKFTLNKLTKIVFVFHKIAFGMEKTVITALEEERQGLCENIARGTTDPEIVSLS